MMLESVAVLPERRDTAIGFYEKPGYAAYPDRVIHGETFTCVYMEKRLT